MCIDRKYQNLLKNAGNGNKLGKGNKIIAEIFFVSVYGVWYGDGEANRNLYEQKMFRVGKALG